MKSKILHFLLIVTSLFGYLEWSGNSSCFLFEAEAGIFSKLFTDPGSVLHPFTIIPFAGQLVLLFTLFQKKPKKVVVYLAIAALGCLLGLMLVIGIMSLNEKIILSTLPFWTTVVIAVVHDRKVK